MQLFKKSSKNTHRRLIRALSTQTHTNTKAKGQKIKNFKNLKNRNFFQKSLRKNFSNFVEPLGPLDGRYQPKVAALSEYFSERAFNGYRIKVEIEWLKFLVQEEIVEFDDLLTKLGKTKIIGKEIFF